MSHPAPLVAARPAEPDEIPRTARTLMTKATAAGWAARATYARGTALGRDADKVVESVVVRLEHAQAGARVVAVWVEGKFDVAFRWAHWLELEMVGVRGLAAWALAVTQLAEGGLEFGEVSA